MGRKSLTHRRRSWYSRSADRVERLPALSLLASRRRILASGRRVLDGARHEAVAVSPSTDPVRHASLTAAKTTWLARIHRKTIPA